MLTALAAVAVALTPFAAVVALLALSARWQRRRQEEAARQVAVTEAIHRELGAVAAPVVVKRAWGPWRVVIPVPLDRPTLVARILAVARPALPPAPVQIVLVARPVGRS
jgi:predicted component of type VI protein secretion system